MLLYLIYDKVKKTHSFPLSAPDADTAINAMKQLNPTNLNDLCFLPICNYRGISDLLCLSPSHTPIPLDEALAHSSTIHFNRSDLSEAKSQGQAPKETILETNQRSKAKKLPLKKKAKRS